MRTIIKARNADCDGGGWSYVVCDDFDINKNSDWYDTMEEAEKAIAEK